MTEGNRALNDLYARVRSLRDKAQENGKSSSENRQELAQELAKIHDELEKNYRSDWLLRYELLELDQKYSLKSPWASTVRTRLAEASKTAKDKADMITRGLDLL